MPIVEGGGGRFGFVIKADPSLLVDPDPVGRSDVEDANRGQW